MATSASLFPGSLSLMYMVPEAVETMGVLMISFSGY